LLHASAHLRPEELHGWPVLRLVLDPVPLPVPFDAYLLFRHYRDALAQGCKNGPLADLAASLELGQ
jgi:hypothetical protein